MPRTVRRRAIINPRCRHKRERQRLHAAHEKSEKAKRRLVRPLQIIKHDQRRAIRSQVRNQPEEAVERAERRDRLVGGRVEHDRRGERSRAS